MYTLVKFFKRSKQGKCGTCDIDRDCCGTEQHTANHFPGNNLKMSTGEGRPDAHFLIRNMLKYHDLPLTTNSLSSISKSTCLTSV